MTKPPRVALAAMTLLFAAAGSARADASFLLGIQGTDERYYPVCRVPDQLPPCNTTVYLPWNGTLHILLDSSADGVYTGTDVLAFDFSTSTGNLSLQSLDEFDSVTIAGGQVSAISFGSVPEDSGTFSVVGLQAGFERDYDILHEGSDVAWGVLSPVPEPGGASLIAWALAGVWLAIRKRRGADRPTLAA